MDRTDVLKNLLYPKCKSAIEFKFDSLRANPLLYYITMQDIAQLHKIATSIKYSSKPKLKYEMIDKILIPRGFKKMASGTNRVVYRFLNDYGIVLKVAIDKVGLSDNGNEYKNQQLLKPFVSKCFEVSPCGTVGLFERVIPITSREEFVNLSEDIFDLINNLIGKYVLEDIGEKFYMNYGLREGFGPVLLDYPYVFELDGRKLICNVQDPLDEKGYCGGEIDYDLGYNDLICTKCGKRYLATELKAEESTEEKPKIIIEGEDIIMKCVLKRGNEVINTLNSKDPESANTIPSRDSYNARFKRGNKDDRSKDNYRPNFKKTDDVGLKCRIRGKKSVKRDIDKEAREKEERAKAAPIIPVLMESEDKKEDNIIAQVSIMNTNGNKTTISINEKDISKEDLTTDKPKGIIICDDDTIYEDGEFIGYRSDSKVELIDNTRIYENGVHVGYFNKSNIIFSESGEIFENGSLIGYTLNGEKLTDILQENERLIRKVQYFNDVIEPDQNLPETESTEEVSHYSGNDNYKTSNIVSPIENHYSKAEDEENSDEEEQQIIPEVVIHPRKDDDDDKINKEF